MQMMPNVHIHIFATHAISYGVNSSHILVLVCLMDTNFTRGGCGCMNCVQKQLVTNITLIDELNEPPVTERDWLLYNITRDFAPCTDQEV